MKALVLVAIEDREARALVSQRLARHGCSCRAIESPEALRPALAESPVRAAVIDTEFGGREAIELSAEHRDLLGDAYLVLRTPRTTDGLLRAMRGLRQGADDVLSSVEDEEEIAAIASAARGEARRRLDRTNGGVGDVAESGNGSVLTPLQQQERNLIVRALEQTEGHVIDAARLLRLGQATVYRKIHKYQIPHVRRRRASRPK